MALNHDIAATRPDHQIDISSDSTAGLTVVALLLALLLGFSAVDIQHRQAPDAGAGMNLKQGQVVLDGRGKWGGYLQ